MDGWTDAEHRHDLASHAAMRALRLQARTTQLCEQSQHLIERARRLVVVCDVYRAGRPAGE